MNSTCCQNVEKFIFGVAAAAAYAEGGAGWYMVLSSFPLFVGQSCSGFAWEWFQALVESHQLLDFCL